MVKMTPLEKMSFTKWLRTHPINSIEDLDFEVQGGRNKNKDFSAEETLEFLIVSYEKAVQAKTGKLYFGNLVAGVKILIETFYENFHDVDEFDKDLVVRMFKMSELYENYLKNVDGAEANNVVEKNLPLIEKILNKHFNKDEVLEVHEETVDELKEILSKLTEERDFLLKKVSDLEEDIRELTSKNDKQSKSISKSDEKIKVLENKKRELTTEVSNLQKRVDELESKICSYESTISAKNVDIKNYRKEVINLRDKNSISESTISSLTEQVRTLSNSLRRLENQVAEINVLKENIASKDKEIDTLKSKVSALQKVVDVRKRNDELDNKIISVLYGKPLTIEKIIAECGLTGVSTKEVFDAINRLKAKYNIQNGTLFNFKQTYYIKPIDVSNLSNKTFSINLFDYSKPLDILVTADAHITNMNAWQKRIYNQIKDYCKENGIHVVLDLGDFIDTGFGIEDRYKYAMEIEEYLDSFIKKLPQSDDITYLMMGGNHEHAYLYCGIDPIARIAEARSDVMNLGYDNANLKIGKSNICLHHFKGTERDLNDSLVITKELEECSKRLNLDRENVYLDLLAHFHRSKINNADNYAFIPSLFNKPNDGAYHLKIYFNEFGEIDYIDFIPLQFKPTPEPLIDVVYKKKR